MRQQENYNDLYAFLTVAKVGSFTKGAAKLGISQSALSRTVKQLEERLKIQLFTRTTRSLSLTQAGEKLFESVAAGFDKIDNELLLLNHYRDAPSGLVRINAGPDAIEHLFIPKLAEFSQRYPDLQLELTGDNSFVDIVAEGFDAGIRFDSDVSEGMIAVRVSELQQIVVVATPGYFQQYGFPKSIDELAAHQCIGYRYSSGGLFHWEFKVNGEKVKIKPQGQFIFNTDNLALSVAKQGLGIAYVAEYMAQDAIASGQLIRIFREHCISYPPFYLYYPHRNVSPALRVVIDMLKI